MLFSAKVGGKFCKEAMSDIVCRGQYFFADPSLFIGEIYFNDLLTIFIYDTQEDAHVANAKFNSNENEALFGVFDGHGGREVAVFSNKHYEYIL